MRPVKNPPRTPTRTPPNATTKKLKTPFGEKYSYGYDSQDLKKAQSYLSYVVWCNILNSDGIELIEHVVQHDRHSVIE